MPFLPRTWISQSQRISNSVLIRAPPVAALSSSLQSVELATLSFWMGKCPGRREETTAPSPARASAGLQPPAGSPSAGGGARAGAPGGSGRQLLQLRGGNGPSPVIHQ